MDRKICEECGGKVVKKNVDYIHLGQLIGKFDAEVCMQCGEKVFNEEVFDKIEQIIRKKGLWGLAAKAKVNKLGNSVAITINKKIADFVNLKKGEEVRVYPEDKHRIVIETLSSKPGP